MILSVDQSREVSGAQAAMQGALFIRSALDERGEARIILATGASQFNMLESLVERTDIDWGKCTVFHLDDYIGLSRDHPASFTNYLNQRFVKRVPNLGHFEAINGTAADTTIEITRLNTAIKTEPIDVAFIGIGENGHLAFNDPPANFETKIPYLRVSLDHACRTQQVSEGWFDALKDVPSEAITMSIAQILSAHAIICTVPDERKAAAVYGAIEGRVTNLCPASALQGHENTWLFLDKSAAKNLTGSTANV
ncbi:MAG: glucosamine-6-phosphate deaminase [Blastopirellula sp.]|nr:MAG: glucosamine-6-phosphate deaminase [Blastopirellula sp.]